MSAKESFQRGEDGKPTVRYREPRNPSNEIIHVPEAALSPETTGATASKTASRVSPATKTRRIRMWVLGTSLVVVVVLLSVFTSACAAPSKPDESTSSESTGAASFESTRTKTYADSVYGYSFEYPADWGSEDASYYLDGEPGNAVQVYSMDTSYASYAGVIISCVELESRFDESMLPEIKIELVGVMEEEARSPQVEIRGSIRATTVGGLKGYEYMSLDTSGGYSSMLQAYYVYDEQLVYSLVFEAAEAAWEDNQANFSIIVGSFRPAPGY